MANWVAMLNVINQCLILKQMDIRRRTMSYDKSYEYQRKRAVELERDQIKGWMENVGKGKLHSYVDNGSDAHRTRAQTLCVIGICWWLRDDITNVSEADLNNSIAMDDVEVQAEGDDDVLINKAATVAEACQQLVNRTQRRIECRGFLEASGKS